MPRKKPRACYQRGDNWRVDTRYRGIRIRETVATEEMAEKALRKAQTLIVEGRYLELKRRTKITLNAFAKRYLAWCETEGQKTIEDKKRRIQIMVDYFGQDIRLSDLTVKDIEGYKAFRQSTPGKRKKEIKPATVNRDLANFKHLLNKAVEWGLLAESPARTVKLLRVQNLSLRYLSSEELKELLKAASAYLKPIIILAVNTGMRRGELLALTWSNINWEHSLVEILDQKNGEHSYLPLNAMAVNTLKKTPHRLNSPYVFSKANGVPPVDFKTHWGDAVKEAKIEHCRFHDLRHTFASHLAMAGVDLLTIKELMRHKTMTMTLRYAHLSPDHTRSAIDKLDFRISKKKQQIGS